MKSGPPIVKLAGLNPEITGAGTWIVKLAELENPPPGEGLNTLMLAVPPEVMSLAGISAFNWVLPIKCVGRFDLFHCTIDDAINWEPMTVNVKLGPPTSCIDGLIELRMGMGLVLGLELLVCPPPLHETKKQTNIKKLII